MSLKDKAALAVAAALGGAVAAGVISDKKPKRPSNDQGSYYVSIQQNGSESVASFSGMSKETVESMLKERKVRYTFIKKNEFESRSQIGG